MLFISVVLRTGVSAENVYLTNDPGDSLRIESSVLTRGCGIPEIIKNTIQSPAFFYDTCNKELFLFSGYSGKWKYYGSVADVVELDTLRTPTSVVILNSSGTNATILAADTVLAGVIAAKDQKKVNRIYPFRDYDELRNADPTDTAVIYEDARGNRFRYDPSSALADDSAMVIVANGKRLVRVFEATLYPEWFGAKGNGIVDDAAAFQKMFNYLGSSNVNSYQVGFINRNYHIGQTVNLPPSFKASDQFSALNIQASGVSFISGVINGPLFQRVHTSFSELQNMLSGYRLIWEGGNFRTTSTAEGSVALKIFAMYGASIKDARFSGFDTAVVARFMLKSTFDNLFFNSIRSVGILGASLSGIVTGAGTSNSAFNLNIITNCRFFHGSGAFASIMLLAADQTVVDRVVSEGNIAPQYNFYYDYQNSSGVQINTFRNIWIETNGGGNTSNFYLRTQGTIILDRIQRIHPDTIFVANLSSTALLKIENMPYLGNIGEKPFKFISQSSGRNLYLGESVSNVFFDPAKYDGGVPTNRYGLRFMPQNGGVTLNANRLLLVAGDSTALVHNRRISVEGSLEFVRDNEFDFGIRTNSNLTEAIGRPRRAFIGTGGIYVDSASTTGFGFGNRNASGTSDVSVASWVFVPPNITRFQGSQGGIDIPRGTTAERGAHYGGRLRWNTDSLTIEVNNGTAWQALATKNDIMNISTTTASKTLVAGIHETVLVNATGGNCTITLPAAAARGSYTIKKIDATANTVTLTGQSGATIDGNADHILTDQYSYITVVSDGANWFITGGN